MEYTLHASKYEWQSQIGFSLDSYFVEIDDLHLDLFLTDKSARFFK